MVVTMEGARYLQTCTLRKLSLDTSTCSLPIARPRAYSIPLGLGPRSRSRSRPSHPKPNLAATTRLWSHGHRYGHAWSVQCATAEHLTPPAPSLIGSRIPVTIITGFLGSGKTTLLNHILNEPHGKRIAVIENEYGEVDIDGSLVAAQKLGAEDIVMLNNGCLCCTVRGDLVRMISELVEKKRDKFDHIIIETTGLANPAPVIQTFYLEEKIAEHVWLDGVVTLVDAKHAPYHLDEVKPKGVVNEAVEQIAYADRIILNKVDLVGETEIKELLNRIRQINSMAYLQRAKFGDVDMDYVLGVGGFDLERVEKDFIEEISSHEHEHEHEHDHDHKCDANCEHDHGHDHHHHEHGHNHSDGKHSHVHDPGVSSVSIVCEGDLDLEKINDWLGDFIDTHSEDLYRVKGVLTIEGLNERFVFQAVHALFEGAADRPWAVDEKRINKLVFIGKNLNQEAVEKGFRECLAQK